MSEPKRYMSDVCNLGPKGYSCLLIQHKEGEFVRYEDYARLKAEVERLTKAVMHSPAAQLKLKELEGKTTYKEINGKIPPCIDRYEAK